MSETEAHASSAIVFECIVPILRVHTLAASIDFYVNVLGFKVDWRGTRIIAGLSRDRCQIMLCEGEQGNPGTWVWMGVSDIAPLFKDFTAKGVKIRNPPTNHQWATEMQIEHPDGHVLRFGSEPKTVDGRL